MSRPTTTRTICRGLPEDAYLEIEAVENDGSGRLFPGFSITGSLWEKRGARSGYTRSRSGHEPDAVGMLHREILRAAPELAVLVDLHLSDPMGVPLHAEANGWYFYSGQAAAYELERIEAGQDHGYSRLIERSGHERAAQALRIDPQDLPTGLDEPGFSAFVESLLQGYRRRAEKGRALLVSL